MSGPGPLHRSVHYHYQSNWRLLSSISQSSKIGFNSGLFWQQLKKQNVLFYEDRRQKQQISLLAEPHSANVFKDLSGVFQGVWFPRPLHRRVQHESSGQAKAAGAFLERPRHQAPLRPAQRVLRLQLVTHHTLINTNSIQLVHEGWLMQEDTDRTCTHKHTQCKRLLP